MRVNPKWSCVSFPLLVLVVGGTVCCIAVFVFGMLTNSGAGSSPSAPAEVRAYLRGGRTLVLRLPASIDPLEQVEVFEDRTVAHVAFTPNPTDIYKKIPLPSDLWRDLDQLRIRWCQQ